VNNAEDLGSRKDEVKDLWQEEQKHCLCKMPQDTNHCKSHASKITKRVTYEYLRWELIVLQ
jgi:hypothetical protein